MRERFQKTKEPLVPPTREQLGLEARQNEKLRDNEHTKIIIAKLCDVLEGKEKTGRPSAFDDQTVKLLERVLISKDHYKAMDTMMPVVSGAGGAFWKHIVTRLGPVAAGIYGGMKAAPATRDWVTVHAGKAIATSGSQFMEKAKLEGTAILDSNTGLFKTFMEKLDSLVKGTKVAANTPGFEQGVWAGLKNLALFHLMRVALKKGF